MNGRVIVVSGGAGAIGEAIRHELRQCGAQTIGFDLRASDEADRAVDVTSPNQVDEAIEGVANDYGRIDGLVCAAGAVSEAPLDELDPKEWARTLDVNLTSVYLLARSARRFLAASGCGSIVALSSGWARRGYPRGCHYAAAKAGVEGLVRSLALELAAERIRVNAIAPGPVDTAFLDQLPDPDAVRARASLIPLGRLGRPADIAPLATLLLDPARAGWITGQVIHANGGLFLS